MTPRDPAAELVAPSTMSGRLLLMAGLTLHNGRRLADSPELIVAIEEEARAAAHRPDAPGLREVAKAASRSMEEWLASGSTGSPEDRAAIWSWSSALRAALAAANPTPEPARGVAWLIERGQSEKQVPTVWWMGNDDWTTDAKKAQRFFSRDAAQTAIESRSPLPSWRDRFGRATEHVFLAAVNPTPDPAKGREMAQHIFDIDHMSMEDD